MNRLFTKFKSIGAMFMAFAFFMAITMSSCTMDAQSSDDEESATEVVNEAKSDEEHPTEAKEGSEEEHPTEDKEGSEEEHPTDSTSTKESTD